MTKMTVTMTMYRQQCSNWRLWWFHKMNTKACKFPWRRRWIQEHATSPGSKRLLCHITVFIIRFLPCRLPILKIPAGGSLKNILSHWKRPSLIKHRSMLTRCDVIVSAAIVVGSNDDIVWFDVRRRRLAMKRYLYCWRPLEVDVAFARPLPLTLCHTKLRSPHFGDRMSQQCDTRITSWAIIRFVIDDERRQWRKRHWWQHPICRSEPVFLLLDSEVAAVSLWIFVTCQ